MRRLNINYCKNELPASYINEVEFMTDYRMSNYKAAISIRKFEIINDALSLIYQGNIKKTNVPSTRKALNDMKILVAEDDKINFLVLNFLLNGKVKKVDRAVNGREAVELAKSNDYDLIFMDMSMPLMGGIEATKIIRKIYPFLPIIAQTAFTCPEEKVKFLAAGCDDVIYKPIKREILNDLLVKYGTN